MEIVQKGKQQPDVPVDKVEIDRPPIRDLTDDAVSQEDRRDRFASAVNSARDELKKELAEQDSAEEKKPDDVVASSNASEHTNGSHIMSSVVSQTDRTQNLNLKEPQTPVYDKDFVVLQKHKDNFIRSVITGERYKEEFVKLGGSLRVVVRCRSSIETDAMESYARRMVIMDKVKLQSEYSSMMRKMLFTAQIDEINGVKYPEMKGPMFIESHDGKIEMPGWQKDYDAWENKPDALVAALIDCILIFEARYWYMVSNSDSENFWKPEESTGE